ncbi:MAG: trypsin-like peptidase domain-containing protein [Pseudomonadota bacterium]
MIMRAMFLVALVLVAPGIDAAERRFITDEEAARWAGVGILRMQGSGTCTGVLIRPDTVLTAAHCVADAGTKTVLPAARIRFHAGWGAGRAVDSIEARTVAVHQGYFASGARYDNDKVRVDLARVTLARPARKVPSYPVGYTPSVGAQLSLLSYSQGRMDRLSIQPGCAILRRETEFLSLDCTSNPGASGAPYFQIGRTGRATVVGINSGRQVRRSGTRALALGFAHARDFIRAGGAGVTAPGIAAGTETGGRAASTPASASSAPRRSRLPGGSLPGDGLKRLTR